MTWNDFAMLALIHDPAKTAQVAATAFANFLAKQALGQKGFMFDSIDMVSEAILIRMLNEKIINPIVASQKSHIFQLRKSVGRNFSLSY